MQKSACLSALNPTPKPSSPKAANPSFKQSQDVTKVTQLCKGRKGGRGRGSKSAKTSKTSVADEDDKPGHGTLEQTKTVGNDATSILPGSTHSMMQCSHGTIGDIFLMLFFFISFDSWLKCCLYSTYQITHTILSAKMICFVGQKDFFVWTNMYNYVVSRNEWIHMSDKTSCNDLSFKMSQFVGRNVLFNEWIHSKRQNS